MPVRVSFSFSLLPDPDKPEPKAYHEDTKAGRKAKGF
jgi:hypothetical protein